MKLCSMSQDQPFMWKTSVGGPINWVGRVSGDLQGESNSVSQVDRALDMALPTGSVGGGPEKEQ